MSKRIKRVFSNGRQVLHLWANQSQSDARSKNVFFEGTDVYSYGRHYLLGRIVEYNGYDVAIINNQKYSVTTNKHQRWSHNACEISLSGNPYNGKKAVLPALIALQGEYIADIMSLFTRTASLYSNNWQDYYLHGAINRFNDMCAKLGHKNLQITIPDEFEEVLNERIAELKTKHVKKQAKHEEQRRLKALNSVANFRKGEPINSTMMTIKPQILRVNGDTVQTSGGAEVPLTHAIRLLRMVKRGTAKSGEPVGGFRLDSIAGNTVKIGCHTISISEAESVLAPFMDNNKERIIMQGLEIK